MSQAKALPQSKDVLLKQYQKRLKDDIRSMVDNYMEIIKSAKVSITSMPIWVSCERLSVL